MSLNHRSLSSSESVYRGFIRRLWRRSACYQRVSTNARQSSVLQRSRRRWPRQEALQDEWQRRRRLDSLERCSLCHAACADHTTLIADKSRPLEGPRCQLQLHACGREGSVAKQIWRTWEVCTGVFSMAHTHGAVSPLRKSEHDHKVTTIIKERHF